MIHSLKGIILRPLALSSFCFATGVLCHQYPILIILPVCLIIALVLAFLSRRGYLFFVVLISLVLGILFTNTYDFISKRKASFSTGDNLTIEARVVSVPSEESFGQRAFLDFNGTKISITTREKILSYGDIVRFTGNINFPSEKKNPNDFDYNTYLKTKGVYLSAFPDEISVIGKRINMYNPIDAINVLREKLLSSIDSLWHGESLMFARAILLGSSDESSDEFNDILSNGSISHIIAVSGMHVSLCAGAILLLLKRFSFKHPHIKFLCLPFVYFYVFLTGASCSSIRAAIMFTIYLIAQEFDYPYDGYISLAASSFFLLFCNPFYIYSLGFILSFSASFSILLFTKPIMKGLRLLPYYIRTLLSVTLAAQILTFPITAIYFGKGSFLSVFTNLVAVPLVPLIMVGGYVSVILKICAFPLYHYFYYLTDILMRFCIKSAEISSKIPFSNIKIIIDNKLLFSICSMLLIVALYFILKGKRWVFTFVCINLSLALIAFFTCFSLYSKGETYFLDVGNGDCTIFLDSHSSVMVDCTSSNKSMYKETVIPFLKGRGMSYLDTLIVTKYNSNDYNIIGLINDFPVKNLILPEGEDDSLLISSAKSNGTEIIYAEYGDTFTLGNISAKVIYGTKDSAFCYNVKNYYDFLICGDISSAQEALLAKDNLSCFVIKAPRNGNKGSLSHSLLNSSNPAFVVVSTNRVLSDDFLERTLDYSVYSTYENGLIYFNKHSVKGYVNSEKHIFSSEGGKSYEL